MSHPVPARDAADRLASLQGLFDKANLLVVTPSSPTLGAQHIDLHSPRDLKARLKAKSSRRLPNYTRRPPPEEYGTRAYDQCLLEQRGSTGACDAIMRMRDADERLKKQ